MGIKKLYITITIVFCLILGSASLSQAKIVYGGPYLGPMTSNSVWISWVTDSAINSGKVEWGLTNSYGNTKAIFDTTSMYDGLYRHDIQITGLSPSTVYHYRVTSDSEVTEDYSFKTFVPEDATSVKFVVVGDVQYDSAENSGQYFPNTELMNRILEYETDINAVIRVGDQVMATYTRAGWEETFFDSSKVISKKYWQPPLLGNHEGQGEPGGIPTHYLKNFKIPTNIANHAHDGYYYSFDIGPAHFIMAPNSVEIGWPDANQPRAFNFSGYSGWSDEETQSCRWMVEDAEEARARGKKWIMVVNHNPVYSTGGYTNHATTELQYNTQGAFRVAVEEYVKADIMFSGHSHIYMRTVPTLDTALNNEGIRYIVTGGATSQIREVTGGDEGIQVETYKYEGGNWNTQTRTDYVPFAKNAAGETLSYRAAAGVNYHRYAANHYILVEINGDKITTTMKFIRFNGVGFDPGVEVFDVDSWTKTGGMGSVPPVEDIIAFPGAEGYGKNSKGGRGGAVYHVTNLNDSGTGSLRAACEASGPRYVVFDVAGIIELTEPITIRDPYITIAGETAPEGGITLYGKNGPGGIHTIWMSGDDPDVQVHDIIMRFIRIRGADDDSQGDALRLYNVKNAIIDHCSFSWASDETADLSRSRDITLQWNIFSDSLDRGGHNLGVFHCYGQSARMSLHHNLIANHNFRMPIYNSDDIDIRNNVMYNWRDGATGHDNMSPLEHSVPLPHDVNIVGNYYKKGPNSRPAHDDNEPIEISESYNYYINDNYYVSTDGFQSDIQNQMTHHGVTSWNDLGQDLSGTPLITTHSVADSYNLVLSEAGCLPYDTVDNSSVSGTRSGSGKWISETDYSLLDNGLFANALAQNDSDNDGMPDSYEEGRGLNPEVQDHNGDINNSGYTNIEEYFHYRASLLLNTSTGEEPEELPGIPSEVVIIDDILKWQAATGIVTGYTIHYGTSAGNYTNSLDVKNVTQYALSNLSLSEGTTYYFVARAYNNIGSSSDSNSVSYITESGTVDLTPPLSPANLEGVIQAGDILLKWNANNEADLKGYRVYYGTSTRDYGLPIPENGLETLVTGLETNVTYYFAITAVDLSGNESGYSNEVSILIPPPASTPPLDVLFYWGMDDISVKELSSKISKTITILGYGKLSSDSARTGSSGLDTIVDGKDSYAQIKIDNMDILNAEKGSLQFWFNHQTLSGYKYLQLIYGDSDNFLSLNVEGATQYQMLHANLRLGGTNFQTAGPREYSVNEWVKIRIAWDLTKDYLRFYINDKLEGENNSVTGAWTTQPSEVRLGASWNVIDCFIDELYISGDPEYLFEPETVDTQAPVVTIISPSSGASYNTTKTPIDIGGTASDNKGVTHVVWDNSAGGNGIATGTENWQAEGIGLAPGENVITITARDEANNESTDTITIIYTVQDTTAPEVTITLPIDDISYITETALIDIGGTASDNVGVEKITWENSTGGNGIAVGTTDWNIADINLILGENIIEVTASDAAGNISKDKLTVNYVIPDVTKPDISIDTPTSESVYSTADQIVSISGTADDNKGVSHVTWTNSTGGNGIAVGTANWSITDIGLAVGENIISITAWDEANNESTDVITITYVPEVTDTTPPSISLTYPTTGTYLFTRSSSIGLRGRSFDDVGISEILWRNSKGGSGKASGTINWEISNIALDRYWNTIEIKAIDTSGNESAYRLTVFSWY